MSDTTEPPPQMVRRPLPTGRPGEALYIRDEADHGSQVMVRPYHWRDADPAAVVSQRLRVCAYCGGPVERSGSVRLKWLDMPGRPTVRWHGLCARLDRDPGMRAPLAWLLAIDARGPDRVDAGAAWRPWAQRVAAGHRRPRP